MWYTARAQTLTSCSGRNIRFIVFEVTVVLFTKLMWHDEDKKRVPPVSNASIVIWNAEGMLMSLSH